MYVRDVVSNRCRLSAPDFRQKRESRKGVTSLNTEWR